MRFTVVTGAHDPLEADVLVLMISVWFPVELINKGVPRESMRIFPTLVPDKALDDVRVDVVVSVEPIITAVTFCSVVLFPVAPRSTKFPVALLSWDEVT